MVVDTIYCWKYYICTKFFQISKFSILEIFQFPKLWDYLLEFGVYVISLGYAAIFVVGL